MLASVLKREIYCYNKLESEFVDILFFHAAHIDFINVISALFFSDATRMNRNESDIDTSDQ